jgi:hypothetical protein
VLAFEGRKAKLSLLACLYIDDHEKDFRFAVRDAKDVQPTYQHIDKIEPHVENTERMYKAKRLIQGCCKGLIDARGFDFVEEETWQSPDLQIQCLLFVHRSAFEIFRQAHISKAMAVQLANFGIVEAASQIHLAELRRLYGCSTLPNYWQCLWVYIIYMHAKNVRIPLRELVWPERNRRLYYSIPSSRECRYTCKINICCSIDLGMFADTWPTTTLLTAKPLCIAAVFGVVGYAKRKLSGQPEIL